MLCVNYPPMPAPVQARLAMMISDVLPHRRCGACDPYNNGGTPMEQEECSPFFSRCKMKGPRSRTAEPATAEAARRRCIEDGSKECVIRAEPNTGEGVVDQDRGSGAE